MQAFLQKKSQLRTQKESQRCRKETTSGIEFAFKLLMSQHNKIFEVTYYPLRYLAGKGQTSAINRFPADGLIITAKLNSEHTFHTPRSLSKFFTIILLTIILHVLIC